MQIPLRRLLATLACIPALYLPPSSAFAQDEPNFKIQGIYSNLDPGETAGVLNGMEIFIVPYLDGEDIRYTAQVQFSVGVPERPQLVDLTVTGTNIAFTANHPDQGEVTFEGEVTEESLIGGFEKLGDLELPRGESLWQWARGSN